MSLLRSLFGGKAQAYGPPPDRPGHTSHAAASFRDRMLASWNPGRRSADADLIPDLPTMVGRSRDLERNSGLAKSGVTTITDNVVGVGLRLSPKPNYTALGQTKEWADEWSRKVRALWWNCAETTCLDAADTLIFDQMSALVLRSQLVNGDACAIPLWLPDRGDGWATKIQIINPDRLSNPSASPMTETLRGGIELDRYGAPLAYHVKNSDPGDFRVSGGEGFNTWTRIPKRLPHGRRSFIHVYDKDLPGQTRGKPILASVLSHFKGLDRYTGAEIQAAVVNAMVALIIETPLNQDGIEALFKDDQEAYLKARNEHAVAIESGSMIPLFPGDKVTPFTPSRPNSAFGAFQENVGRIIALGYDMPYELLFKDFTKANYSSMRAAMLEAWRSFTRRRDNLGTQWADVVYMLWLEEAIDKGLIEAPLFYEQPYSYARCRWIGPGRGWVDPVKEAQAAGERLKGRISTLEDECAEQGRDWMDVLDQLKTEEDYTKEIGLSAPIASKPGEPGPGAPDPGQGTSQDAEDQAARDEQTTRIGKAA